MHDYDMQAVASYRGMNQESELRGAYCIVCTRYCKVRSVMYHKRGKKKKKVLHEFRREGEALDTVTLFSVAVRDSSLAVSRNSVIGLSCVTHWIRSSLCSSNRTDKVFPSSVLPGGESVRDAQEKQRS